MIVSIGNNEVNVEIPVSSTLQELRNRLVGMKKLPTKDDEIQSWRFLTNHPSAKIRVVEDYAEEYTSIQVIACDKDRIEMQNTIYTKSRYIDGNEVDTSRDFLAVRTSHFR